MNKNNEYTCALCGGVFKKGWPDEEAQAESKKLWGNIPDEDMELVCDDCFKKCSPDANPKLYEEYKDEHPEHFKDKKQLPVTQY